MRFAAPVLPPVVPPPPALRRRREPEFRFQSLMLTEAQSLAKGKSTTFSLSLILHLLLLAGLIILPLVGEESPPAVSEAVRAFFVAPAHVAPPPPPPPPATAATVRIAPKAPVAPRPVEEAKFVAPIEVPTEIKPEEAVDLLGAEGGVPGGVEGGVPGGVPGGVVGGIVGGLLEAAPPPKVVRVGGLIVAPKLVHYVAPVYPPLALQARVSGVVILEAEVDTQGNVKTARVVRGKPFIEVAALEAVKQWRYQPLLLDGRPTQFILTVTLTFDLANAGRPANDLQ